MTLRLTIDRSRLNEPDARRVLKEAAQLLRTGRLVALPTETVYGLGADALNPAAVAKIFVAKRRPSWDPLIVHVASEEMLRKLVTAVPAAAQRLIDAFWPGPLTLLLPRSEQVADGVTAGRMLVGIRMPADPVALALIREAAIPVAAPSANTFGHTSPTTADHVLEDLEGRIDAVLDAGPTTCGVESTVLDPNQSPMVIYRPGAVTLEQLRAVAGCEVEFYRSATALFTTPPQALPSPGVGLRHYAPRARLILVDAREASELGELRRAIVGECGRQTADKVGVLAPLELERELAAELPNVVIQPWGSWSDPDGLASSLFAGLRALDAAGCAVIVCPRPAAEGIGAAIRDRLEKAATE